ncbi:MAG TPA: hypothetical protein VF469_03370 [Kofleriaceae bacterium]
MLEAAPAAQPAAAPASTSSGAELLEGAAKIEGGTLFSGPDAGISADVPSLADPAKASDEDYEKTMGIKAAIDKKTMLPVDGINGQSFTATGCAGKKDGKVTFTFDRAFIGDYDYPAAGKAVRGVHVSISAALSGCGEHKEVKMVQVYRYFTKKDGKTATAEPTTAKRKERAGWNDDKAKSKGWQVDGLDTDTTPFYVSSDIYGNDGTDKAAARLRDSPGSWATDKNIGKEFRTCAVSYAGGKGTVLACIDWGYYIDDKGAASFYPAKPTAYAGSVQELTDAAERWDGLAGNTKANLVK